MKLKNSVYRTEESTSIRFAFSRSEPLNDILDFVPFIWSNWFCILAVNVIVNTMLPYRTSRDVYLKRITVVQIEIRWTRLDSLMQILVTDVYETWHPLRICSCHYLIRCWSHLVYSGPNHRTVLWTQRTGRPQFARQKSRGQILRHRRDDVRIHQGPRSLRVLDCRQDQLNFVLLLFVRHGDDIDRP